MRIGIVSDTHANLQATKAVLEHMEKVGVDLKVHCGDIVGYGPSPTEVLELTLQNFNYIIMGNHDFACVDENEAMSFNPVARQAVEWTQNRLSKEHLDILSGLEYSQKIDNVLFAHGSPNEYFDYLDSYDSVANAFLNPVEDFDICFVGHTHIPSIWEYDSLKRKYEKPITFKRPSYEESTDGIGKYIVKVDKKMIINVGSVGQPRDNIVRSSYAIYDTDTQEVEMYRIPYSIDKTIGLMQREGIDYRLWERLMYGI